MSHNLCRTSAFCRRKSLIVSCNMHSRKKKGRFLLKNQKWVCYLPRTYANYKEELGSLFRYCCTNAHDVCYSTGELGALVFNSKELSSLNLVDSLFKKIGWYVDNLYLRHLQLPPRLLHLIVRKLAGIQTLTKAADNEDLIQTKVSVENGYSATIASCLPLDALKISIHSITSEFVQMLMHHAKQIHALSIEFTNWRIAQPIFYRIVLLSGGSLRRPTLSAHCHQYFRRKPGVLKIRKEFGNVHLSCIHQFLTARKMHSWNKGFRRTK